MALPSLDDIALPLLRVLGDGAAWRVREASQRLESDFGLTEEDLRENIAGPEIQAFIGALQMKHARKGVFIATSDFTPAARAAVRNLPAAVVLIHGEQLADLMIEYQVGVSVEHHFRVCRLDADYFQDLE